MTTLRPRPPYVADERTQLLASTSDDGDVSVEGAPLGLLLEEHAAQCARSNEIAAATVLDQVGAHTDRGVGQATLRWMLQHMLEETARPLGHLDVVRELDGEKGGC